MKRLISTVAVLIMSIGSMAMTLDGLTITCSEGYGAYYSGTQWECVRVLASGPDYYTRIAQGLVDGATGVFKFGVNPDVDTGSTPETIWDGSVLYTYSTNADINGISSSNALDKQLMWVEGLDTNWDSMIQYVLLNGQNKVTFSRNFLRVYRVFNADGLLGGDAGSDVQGDIYVSTSDANIVAGVPDDITHVRAKILGVSEGNQQTEMDLWSVPACHYAYIHGGSNAFANTRTAVAIVKIYVRLYNSVFRNQGTIPLPSSIGVTPITITPPLRIPPKTDVEGRVTEVTANDSAISGTAEYWLERIPGCSSTDS